MKYRKHVAKNTVNIYRIKHLSLPPRETLSFNPVFSPFYIGDGQIASSMAVYHSTIFCY